MNSHGPDWRVETFLVPSDKEGVPAQEVDVYYCDILGMLKVLLSNPDFNNPDIMAYEPKEVYTHDCTGESKAPFEREYGEAFTSDWWNTMQVR
jgi:hypothetical protein